MIQYKHILMTLALLLTAVTGAWATDETLLTTITPTGDGTYSETTAGAVTVTPAGGFYSGSSYGWRWDYYGSLTVTANEGYTITRCVFIQQGKNQSVTISEAPFELNFEEFVCLENYSMDGVSSIEVYGTAPAAITVEPVEGKTNEWTFSMPGSDVVLTPQYAPAAQLAENGAPAAVSGLEIAADAAIITAGQSAQGTLLYAVGTSATEKPALTAFSATLPNAKDQTAAGTYYVWYYIQGKDTPQGQEPSADNTFNDSEIMGPVTVELLTNEHTLNIKQSPNITVTVAGTPKTPTDDKVTPVTTGQEVKIKANTGYKFRKVEVKKGAPATALAPALENGATVVIICNWGYATTTFTYTNNGGTFSGQASGLEANYFNNGLELNGKNLSFSASNVDVSEYLSVGITFNTESSAYSYTGKGEDFASFTISVNGTDVTDQLTELK